MRASHYSRLQVSSTPVLILFVLCLFFILLDFLFYFFVFLSFTLRLEFELTLEEGMVQVEAKA